MQLSPGIQFDPAGQAGHLEWFEWWVGEALRAPTRGESMRVAPGTLEEPGT